MNRISQRTRPVGLIAIGLLFGQFALADPPPPTAPCLQAAPATARYLGAPPPSCQPAAGQPRTVQPPQPTQRVIAEPTAEQVLPRPVDTRRYSF
ncbi:hypothetical protein K9B43_13490 [Pseudomonas sp. S5(2021)]|jgi:hypothetical protein|uniref:hypothetical protein n=1 Tax=Stutzerimonas balearica TaxID=74829 RepID=UPI0007731D90|nr:hypothetical protein [Stutzerimonas balearica]MBZ5756599.1 hypothetical protein [Pseudomonas sp. S5(2021)]OMG63486.1 hypothetical protein AUR59_015890 [Stutzerimonas balearica]WAN08139.1 hypothetical protein D3P44_011885 [Stutzerimonas balearica]